jgi:hypothetical protein
MYPPARQLGSWEYFEAERARTAAWKVRRPTPSPTQSEPRAGANNPWRSTADARGSAHKVWAALVAVLAIAIFSAVYAVAADACPATVARAVADNRAAAGAISAGRASLVAQRHDAAVPGRATVAAQVSGGREPLARASAARDGASGLTQSLRGADGRAERSTADGLGQWAWAALVAMIAVAVVGGACAVAVAIRIPARESAKAVEAR